jgi:hemoglobin-like flavoprotein
MNDFEEVKLSLARSMITGDIIGRFYDILLASNPNIKSMFSKTDFSTHKQLLRQSIGLAIMFANGNAVGKKGIQRIKKSHSKTALNISPNLYPYWKKSFIQAIAELDSEFSDELKKEWDFVLQQTIDYIIDGYED